jgi:hypothetical protein
LADEALGMKLYEGYKNGVRNVTPQRKIGKTIS